MADRAAGAVWADVTGRTRLTIIKAATTPCTILTALQAKSNCGVLYNWDGDIDDGPGTATAAVYQAANSAAVLVFQTGSGSVLRLTLPAPDSSIFLADGSTVDPAQVAGIVAACIGNLSDGAGNTAATFVAGYLAPTANDLTPIGG